MPVKFQWLCIWLTLLVLRKNKNQQKVTVFLIINHLLFSGLTHPFGANLYKINRTTSMDLKYKKYLKKCDVICSFYLYNFGSNGKNFCSFLKMHCHNIIVFFEN